jgi:elongation factor Ts
MAAITAQDVNKLRTQTGAGMMDCKKALTEAGGDFDKAIEILRKKGEKISANRQDREATEGMIVAKISADGKRGLLLELNCETDFVARNEDFQGIANSLAAEALKAGAKTAEEVKALNVDGKAVEVILTEAMGRIGEKIDVSHFEVLEAEAVTSYIHAGSRVGVLVGFGGVEGINVATVGKDVGMQIASMRPLALNKDGVDPSVIQKEIEIGMVQARRDGKPEAMLEKIAQGKLGKFYKENTLLEQDFVKDPSLSVEKYVKTFGPNLVVTGFKRLSLA